MSVAAPWYYVLIPEKLEAVRDEMPKYALDIKAAEHLRNSIYALVVVLMLSAIFLALSCTVWNKAPLKITCATLLPITAIAVFVLAVCFRHQVTPLLEKIRLDND